MRHYLFFKITILLTFCSIVSYSQVPEWAWANGSGGNATDYATSITTDADLNVYSTGWFKSDTIAFDSIVLINTARDETTDIFIAKYDSSGLLLWAKKFGGPGNDESISIKTNSSGDLFLAGSFKSTTFILGDITLKNEGGSDAFIARLNPDGSVVWAKSAGNTGDDQGNSISCDTKDHVYLTGMFESTAISFGNIILTNTGGHDVYLTCYDGSGNAVWAKNMGGENDDTGSIVTTDANGGVYLTGKFSSSSFNLGDTALTNGSNGGEIFLAKYNSSGKLIWGKSLGGSYLDEGYNITSDRAGNIYMSGWFKSDTVIFGCDTLKECTIITRASGSEFGDIFIAKYDTDGKPLWAKRAGGMAKDYGFGFTADAGGDVYITGVFISNFISSGAIQLKNASSNDILIARYNTTGEVIWAKSIYGSAMSRCITTDLNSDVYIAGVFNSPQMRFGNTLLTNEGNGDVFVARLK